MNILYTAILNFGQHEKYLVKELWEREVYVVSDSVKTNVVFLLSRLEAY